MTVPLWVVTHAAEFWELAGGAGLFPRALEEPCQDVFGLPVVALPALSVGRVRKWLSHRGIDPVRDGPDRLLRACLIARIDGGVIFLDADDGESERRFSLAHELAHFLRHYREPRRR